MTPIRLITHWSAGASQSQGMTVSSPAQRGSEPSLWNSAPGVESGKGTGSGGYMLNVVLEHAYVCKP
jgi:hypothetical protein